jgi:hypothetical protein
MQRTPAGLPCGMPGIGEEIDGAMQQAPQPRRHDKASVMAKIYRYDGNNNLEPVA